MATPTDEQLAARGLSREQYNQRNELWHALLAKKPPEERARINENTGGIEGLLLAGQVEMALAEHEKKVDLFDEWHKPFEVEQPREDLEAPPFRISSEGGYGDDHKAIAEENERLSREYKERLARYPKVRELMRRGSSERWTLRFWFNAPLEQSALSARRQEVDRIVRDIMLRIMADKPMNEDTVQNYVSYGLDQAENSNCSAYEIVNAYTGDGQVIYLEWP